MLICAYLHLNKVQIILSGREKYKANEMNQIAILQLRLRDIYNVIDLSNQAIDPKDHNRAYCCYESHIYPSRKLSKSSYGRQNTIFNYHIDRTIGVSFLYITYS